MCGGEDLIRGRLEGEYWVTLMCLLIISSIGSVSHSDSWLVSQSVSWLVSQSVSWSVIQSVSWLVSQSVTRLVI